MRAALFSERDQAHPGYAMWGPALLHAVPISSIALALFYYWFGVANRYVIFLYEHLGAGPFDAVTSSRYWMSGLVAAGAVMVGYTLLNGGAGQLAVARQRSYRPPAWWRVWLLCAVPLAAGIPAITMSVNWPALPLSLALACTLATLAGLAFALMPGAAAARRPADLAWLVLDGVGLMPSLLLLRAVELPARGLRVSVPVAYLAAFGGTLGGAAWLGIMSALRARRRKPHPRASALFVAGLCLSYLLMPLAHYVLGAPEYRYITTSSNFFAFRLDVQVIAFAVAGALALGCTWLRRTYIKEGTA
jgi:hypothetical protein